MFGALREEYYKLFPIGENYSFYTYQRVLLPLFTSHFYPCGFLSFMFCNCPIIDTVGLTLIYFILRIRQYLTHSNHSINTSPHTGVRRCGCTRQHYHSLAEGSSQISNPLGLVSLLHVRGVITHHTGCTKYVALLVGNRLTHSNKKTDDNYSLL